MNSNFAIDNLWWILPVSMGVIFFWLLSFICFIEIKFLKRNGNETFTKEPRDATK